jgi:hypothetical protein
MYKRKENGHLIGGRNGLIVSLRRADLTLPKHCQAGAQKGYENSAASMVREIFRFRANLSARPVSM